jgi:hypothetical protein
MSAFVIYYKLPKENNQPIGENTPNLVTLPFTQLTVGMYVQRLFGRAFLHMRFKDGCPGGVAQWTSHPLQEREDLGSNPARV